MIAAPITAADGKALGVIAARLNPSWLMAAERATLADHHPLRDGTELLLLDRHGVVIDGPAALMDAAVPFGGTDPDDRFFQVTRLGGEDYDVGRPVGTRAPELDRLGWSVVAVQPIAMAARPLTWLSIDTTVIATAAGLVLLACGWIIVSGACQPLTALGKTASRMAAGDRVPSIPTLGDYAEVRSLSHSLQALDDRMREGERRSSMIGRSLKDRDMLLRTMAHDLRSPLTAALSLAETLANPASRLDAERRVAVAAGCFQAVRNMQDMLDNLLRWTFLTMEVAPVSTPVDIRQLIHDSLAMSFATAEMKSVDLIVEVPPLTVEADPDMIGTIVRNLVNNAVKFTREGGVVRVTARMADGGMTLTVSDTGVGMGARTIAALFAEGSSHAILPTTPGTDGEPGTGLGLMLCRDLVERCGGRIAVESVEGSGTAFQVFLPVRPASSGSERRYPTA
jgi:signal transduction histidine kinase